MKSYHKTTLITFFLTVLAFGAFFAAKIYLPPLFPKAKPDYSCDRAVAMRLDKLVEQYKDSLGATSIFVYDITADSVLFAYNPDEALTPASCQKIITTFAAYDHLAEYNNAFADSLFTVGDIDSLGNIRGGLYLKGSYDPLLLDFSSFAHSLKAKGIKAVKGDIVFQLRVEEKYENADIPRDSMPVLYKGAFAIAEDLRSNLAKVGIEVSGKNTFITPDDALPFSMTDTLDNGRANVNLVHAENHTLEEIMTHLMQHSDNRSAEAVFFCLSASTGHGKKGNECGATIINQSLKKFFPNLTDKQCHVVDGSGLSYDNKVTAHVLVDLLCVAHNYGLLGHFLVNEAMPKSGSTGTLRHRMKGTPAEGSIYAKTGTLPNFPASSLAGYCQSTRGHLLSFAIISNGKKQQIKGYTHLAKEFENQFCIEMCR